MVILGECYKLDVLNNDRKGLEFLLSTTYAQSFKEDALKSLPKYKEASRQCFISRKYAEYIQLIPTPIIQVRVPAKTEPTCATGE